QTDTQRAEGGATANKSRWGLLPKVRWDDLIKDALSEDDRTILLPYINSAALWNQMKLRMNRDLKNPALVPEAVEARLNEIHDGIIKKHTMALSSTGKPLPVERYTAQKFHERIKMDATGKVTGIESQLVKSKTEPVVVFEFRT